MAFGWGFLALLVAVVVLTATLSGIFGMAGGILLMGFLAWTLAVDQAMMLHGAIQAVSNGYRAVLHRDAIRWSLMIGYGAGALIAMGLLALIAYVPSKPVLFLVLGAVPFVGAALPKRWALDITRRGASFFCGVVITLLNLIAGVAGPLLDVFFVRTELTRHEVVATKAVTQTFSHLLKLVYFGVLVPGTLDLAGIPWWVFFAMAPFAMLGTVLGKQVLDRLSDTQFRKWSQAVVLAIGSVLIVRGLLLVFA